MKKLLALCLALLSLVSVAASAEVLADGWQDAGLEALQQAQQDIANRISELRAASAPAADRVELSGSGTSILTDVAIDFSPARVIIECDQRRFHRRGLRLHFQRVKLRTGFLRSNGRLRPAH